MAICRFTARSRGTRLAAAGLLVLGIAVLAVPSAASAAVTVSDCPATETALQADITAAGVGGTVSFNCTSPTTIPFDTTDGGSGAITVSQDLTLDASAAAGKVTFDGGKATQLLVVNSAVTLTLKGLTLQNGYAPVVQATQNSIGGAIYNDGTLTVDGCTFSDNTLDGTPILVGGTTYNTPGQLGGAIYSDGQLTVTNSNFSGNSSGEAGGAIDAGTASVSGSTFTGNAAGDGGGAISIGGGTITGSIFSGNSAADGTVATGSGVAITDSTFTGNHGAGVENQGGTLTITGSTFSGNTGAGALYNQSGTTTVNTSTMSGNTGPDAGAIAIDKGEVDVNDSTLSGNTATSGGAGAIVTGDGGFSGVLKVNRSTISGNTGVGAGAIGTTLGTAFISNSAITGNTASGAGAVGGIANIDGTLTITNSTLAGNSGAQAAELDNGGGPLDPAVIQISGSIIATAAGSNCYSINLGKPATITDSGYNLEWSGSGNADTCGFTPGDHDITGQDPELGALADNGGPTETLALEAGSPAIGAIPLGTGLCPPTDQRGVLRPSIGGKNACDIGAYESAFTATTATTTAVMSSANPSVIGQPVTFTATVSPAQGTATPTGTVQFSIDGATVGGPVGLDGSGHAIYSTSALTATNGTNHTVTAAYTPANSTFTGSSGSLTGGQEVDKIGTTTQVAIVLRQAVLGGPVPLIATVSANSPGQKIPGTVTFYDGTTSLGTATVAMLGKDGVALLTTSKLPVGTQTITAVYGGSGTLQGSTSAGVTVEVEYVVRLLSLPLTSVIPGGAVPIKLALEAFVNGRLANVSSASIPVTALCVVPLGDATCGNSPTISLNAPFSYSGALDKGAGGYEFDVTTPKTMRKGTYSLLFRAAGEPTDVYHADAAAIFTVRS